MAIEIKVPALPESVSDAVIATWHKKIGEAVKRDENLVDLETDKVVLEVPAPADGVLKEIKKTQGATVNAQDVIAIFEAGAVAQAAPAKAAEPVKAEPAKTASSAPASANLSPAVRRAVQENNINPQALKGTGKDGRPTRQDVIDLLQSHPAPAAEASVAPATTTKISAPINTSGREEKRVPMTRLRARIAERLLDAKQNTAMLTTFNEINMKPVMDLRAKYKDIFEKRHGVKLGFMSFFVKAVVEALKRFPSVNASIDGTDIIYHGYFDIGVAVSTERGLVVPIIRNADQLSLAEIEKAIGEYAVKARDGKLSMDEMTGGTFTISNGGVFGSLMATPILNPPQTGILGMHKIQERPIAENGQVVIRPMMYIALSYDHRMIDGRESVQFLVTVKELLEDPSRILLEI